MEKSEIWGCGGVSNFSGARGASGIECSIAHLLIRKESHVCLARVLLLCLGRLGYNGNCTAKYRFQKMGAKLHLHIHPQAESSSR